MIALDTCVLARAIVGDDPTQTSLAETRLAAGGFVPLTVTLELAWLLRSRYRYSRSLLADTIEDLCRHPGLTLAEENAMPWLIARLRMGADVGDLVHLLAARFCTAFATFDDMHDEVGPDAPIPIELLR